MRRFLSITIAALLIGVLLGAAVSEVWAAQNRTKWVRLCDLREVLYQAGEGGVFLKVEKPIVPDRFSTILDAKADGVCAWVLVYNRLWDIVPEGEEEVITPAFDWMPVSDSRFIGTAQQAWLKYQQQRWGVR